MTELTHPLPLHAEHQRQVARHWQSTQLAGRVPAAVRPVVADSWTRALRAGVSPALRAAPMVRAEAEIETAQARHEWLGLALRCLTVQRGAYAAGGSVVALFDARGRMVHCEGEARALDGLAAINFRPGSLWAEDAVGTNGPGTALATGRPVHVIGAEHFCEEWQGWHCAAVPLRDPFSRAVLGALDLSGFRESAHPHTLMLVMSLAATIEQMLAARQLERRAHLLERFADRVARWPGDALVAVDRGGGIVAASPGAPAALHPLAPVPERLRAALAALITDGVGDAPFAGSLPCAAALEVEVHPVLQRGIAVGACLRIVPAAEPRRPAERARRAPTDSTRYSLDDLVGDSPALRDAHAVAIAAAANALPVLLLGESGTGKEVFAQGIHAASGRAARPFIAVNCAALPTELVESELFGYVGGAFSGARREGGIGKFEAANGGTIFLDEIGDLPLAAQAALLRVLQEGSVTRVGAVRGSPVDVRVVAATNRDIRAALAAGTFREDLYYRLSVLCIELPPLRERRADVERLSRRFLADAEAELGREGHAFAAEALDTLRAHDWPGNIRELKNVVWRAVALSTGSLITTASLPHAVRADPTPVPVATAGDAASLTRSPTATGGSSTRRPERASGPAPADEWEAGRERVACAIERAGSMGEAAAILGVARSTLYRQLERYGLQPARVARPTR